MKIKIKATIKHPTKSNKKYDSLSSMNCVCEYTLIAFEGRLLKTSITIFFPLYQIKELSPSML